MSHLQQLKPIIYKSKGICISDVISLQCQSNSGADTVDTLIKGQMHICTKKFFDEYSKLIYNMVAKGYQDGILHNPRLVMYKMMPYGVKKTDNKKVSAAINTLKYQGKIPNNWTIDTTRSITEYTRFNDVQDGLDALANSYYLDRWKNQPMKVLLMCEASGYLGVIRKIANDYRMPYVPAKGDMSIQLKIDIANRITEPTTILYYGDYDRKGIQIPKTIESHIRAINPKADFEMKRMFINEDQIDLYDLEKDEDGNVQMEQLAEDIAINESKLFIDSIIDHTILEQDLNQEKLDRELIMSKAKALRCNSSSGAEDVQKELTAKQLAQIIVKEKEKGKNFSGKDIADLFEEQAHLYSKPKTFEPIVGSTIFFEGATHLIAAVSKEGKTTKIIDEVSKLTNKTIIVLDGDGNGVDTIVKKGDNTTWFQPINADDFFSGFLDLVYGGIDFSGTVFFVDSLKNFTAGHDIDSNTGSGKIITRIKKLTATGASLIIAHHITLKDGEPKLKGNSESIYSSCDITYSYSRDNGLNVLKSRIAGMENGKRLGYGQNLQKLQAKDEL